MIRKFLDLSTAHLSPDTRGWLDEQGRIASARGVASEPDRMIAMGSMPHGWFVHADGEACTDAAAFNRLLERRNVLTHSYSDHHARNGAIRDAIIGVDKALAALISAPSADIPLVGVLRPRECRGLRIHHVRPRRPRARRVADVP